jgi:hypothetical protein
MGSAVLRGPASFLVVSIFSRDTVHLITLGNDLFFFIFWPSRDLRANTCYNLFLTVADVQSLERIENNE